MVTLAVLSIGGSLTLLFLLSLEHMPDLDLMGSTALLSAVALIGLAIVLFIGGGGTAPALVSVGMDSSRLDPTGRARYLCWCSLPAWAVLITFLLQTDGTTKTLLPSMIQGLSTDQIFTASIGLALLTGCLLARHAIGTTTASALKTRPAWLHGSGLAFYFSYLSLVWIATFSVALVSLAFLQDSESGFGWRFYAALMSWLMLLVGLNATIAHTGTALAAVRGAIVAIAFLIPVLIVLGNVTGVAIVAFRKLGLADIRARLVVTAEGCNALNAGVRGVRVCELQADRKVGVVCPVVLKSRVGSPYLIEFAPIDAQGRWPSGKGSQVVQLARQHVLAWPRLDGTTSTPESQTTRATPSPVLSSAGPGNAMEREWILHHCGT